MKETCKICQCLSENHIYYFKCPLLNGAIVCSDCCFDILEHTSKFGLKEEEVASICSSCKRELTKTLFVEVK